MYKLALLFIFLFSSFFSFSQIVNIPDANFLQALIDHNVDTNGDGQIQESEAQAQNQLTFYYKDFVSMEGINAFTNLQGLTCRNNDFLKAVEITGLNNLSSCYFEYNVLLDSVSVVSCNSLNRLEIEQNKTLSTIQISSLNDLDLYIRYNNSLVDVGISDINLQHLDISNNNSLAFIDFSGISSIETLTIKANNLISNYDLSALNSLSTFVFEENNSVASIDLSSLHSLTHLILRKNSSLVDIDFGQSSGIVLFECKENNSLSSLDLFNLGNMNQLVIDANNSLASLDFSGLNSLNKMTIRNSPSLVTLDFSFLPNLEDLDILDNNALKTIDFGISETLSSLDIIRNNSLELPDFVGLIALVSLRIESCQSLISIDIHDLTNLSSIILKTNNLVSGINLNNLPTLSSLSIENHSLLTNISWQSLNSLHSFNLSNNDALQSCNLSNLTSLHSFDCYGNENIESLTFENLPLLYELDFDYNYSLSSLELEDLHSLSQIYLHGHPQLSSIKLRKLNSLITVNVSSNGLIENLELEDLNSLELLDIENLANQKFEMSVFPSLKSLMLDYCVNLDSLIIKNLNSLTHLDINNCDLLTHLKLDKLNSLSNFEITSCDSFNELDLSDLPSLDNIRFNNNAVKYLNVMGVPLSCYLNIYNEEIEWICAHPNQISWLEEEIDLEGVILDPTCNFTGWGDFKTLALSLKYSNSENCDNEADISTIDKSRFRIVSNELDVLIEPIMNSSGQFEINLPPNDYQITPVFANQDYFDINPDPLEVKIDSDIDFIEKDFCLSSGLDSLSDCSIHVIPLELARPGFEVVHKIIISNHGNYPASGQINYEFQEEVVTYVNSTLPLTDNSGTLVGYYENIEPFQSFSFLVTLRLNSPMDTPALDGDENLQFIAGIFTELVDVNHIDNRYVLIEEVRNAFDPNDKLCLQGDYFLDELIGKYLSYRIRFENTGNASAVNVRIVDEIDPEFFDISTLKVLESSHPVYTKIVENEVAFLFEDIYLPYQDSLNDGFVIFEVKTWNDLKIEDKLENTAEIYFDFNFPVVTNTASIQIVSDHDGDGFIHLFDCDDSNPDVNPDATEIIYNGEDDDCNPATLDDDLDQDGYGIDEDCDDTNPDINPGAEEIADNGIDEDCDGSDLITNISEPWESLVYVYPNPVKGIVYLDIAEKIDFKISIYNLEGRLLKSEINARVIDVNTLPNATYLLKIQDLKTNEKIVKRIIIDK